MNTSYSGGLIYEAPAKYDLWLKLLLGGVTVITLGLGIYLLSIDVSASAIMFGVSVFDGLLFYLVLPHRYQVFEDRLRISLGRPFAVTIPFHAVKEIKLLPAGRSTVYTGLKMATSFKNVVEITRKTSSGVIISPVNRELFVEQINQVIEIYRRLNPDQDMHKN